jgi:hypothetical protein
MLDKMLDIAENTRKYAHFKNILTAKMPDIIMNVGLVWV